MMTNSSSKGTKSGWEVDSWEDAWPKVVGALREDSEQTERDVNNILRDVDIADVESALEIGAGYGRLLKVMGHRIKYVGGVDTSNALIRLSADYLDPNIPVIKCKDGLLPAKSDLCDLIYSYTVFQHMHTLEIIECYIQETFRVLKPGGVCRIQTVKGKSNPSMVEGGLHKCHLFEHENDFLKLFLDAGFEATVEVGLTHFQHIWITGRKPLGS